MRGNKRENQPWIGSSVIESMERRGGERRGRQRGEGNYGRAGEGERRRAEKRGRDGDERSMMARGRTTERWRDGRVDGGWSTRDSWRGTTRRPANRSVRRNRGTDGPAPQSLLVSHSFAATTTTTDSHRDTAIPRDDDGDDSNDSRVAATAAPVSAHR